MLTSGMLATVIPVRDPRSLAPTGSYLLVFGSATAAKSFCNRLRKVRSIAYKHTLRCVEGPIPPPPGYIDQGVDAYDMVQRFTIMPPSHHFMLKLLGPGVPEKLQPLLKVGGYERHVGRDAKPQHSVTAWVDGTRFNARDWRAVLTGQDARRRGMPWKLARRGIRAIDQAVGLNVEMTDDDDGGTIEKQRAGGCKGGKEGGGADDAAKDDDDGGGGRDEADVTDDASGWRKGLGRCVLSFESAAEAHRFVREWHRRPVNMDVRGRPKVGWANIEMLW